MRQTELLTDPPAARRRDPITSKAAAHDLDRSGRRARDKATLLGLVAEFPDRTALELAEILIERGTHWLRAFQLCNKRISDLSSAGVVVASGIRKCEISGRAARTWRERGAAS